MVSLCCSSWDYGGHERMLAVVGPSVKGGSTNGSILLVLRGIMPGKTIKWLEVVVGASVKGGSKNGSSLLVLRGTMLGKTIQWLGVIVVPLCQFFVGLGWQKKMLEIVVASVKGGSKHGSSLSVLRGTMPGGLLTGLGLLWILQQVAAKMVPLCQFFVGLCWRKKNARDCRGFCKRWQQKWFLSVGSSWDYAGGIINWLGSVVVL